MGQIVTLTLFSPEGVKSSISNRTSPRVDEVDQVDLDLFLLFIISNELSF